MTRRWWDSSDPDWEYRIRGFSLGLCLYVSLVLSSWGAFAAINAWIVFGLALALVVSAFQRHREGYRPRGRVAPFLLFLILESSTLIYLGVGLALFTGMVALFATEGKSPALVEAAEKAGGSPSLFVYALILFGIALGLIFAEVRRRRPPTVKWSMVALWTVLLLWPCYILWIMWNALGNTTLLGAQLLVSVPVLYVLLFAGKENETELEIAILAAMLGLGWAMLTVPGSVIQISGLVVTGMTLAWYLRSVLKPVRIFKHALRGLSYARLGHNPEAIACYRHALALDPQNELAREGLWNIHKTLDPADLTEDPATLQLLDFSLCLDRVQSLLCSAKPDHKKLDEARRLLDLVASQRPAYLPAVHYWRSVLATHSGNLDQAVSELESVLNSEGEARDAEERRRILYPAWRLALAAHPELTRRVGQVQLGMPGRRMRAISAVEQRLAQDPTDPDAWALKQALYGGVTMVDYEAVAPGGARAKNFDHAYCLQLGQGLIQDREQWRRGATFLELAARGLEERAPSIYAEMARAYQREGDADSATGLLEKIKRMGRERGARHLGPEDRQAYFSAVKYLADQALAQDRTAAAIENLQLYTEYERSGLETLRVLAGLFEKAHDPLAALRVTEKALLYNGKDKDLLEKKDRYYYSVLPEDLKNRKELVGTGFDVDYCLNKARKLLDAKGGDQETVEWALHLVELARVILPDSLAVKVLCARANLRRGERDTAVGLLESARSPRPEKFASEADEEAWYLANRLLGDLYLSELARPDLALECFTSYRQSAKSGADTLFKLGQAYEQLGDHPRAVKFYKHVTSYDGHPLSHDAYDAISRLESAS